MAGLEQRDSQAPEELSTLSEYGKRVWDLLLQQRDPEGLRYPNEVVYCDSRVFRWEGDTCDIVLNDYYAPATCDGDYDKVKKDWYTFDTALFFQALAQVEPGKQVFVHGTGKHVDKDKEEGYGHEGHDWDHSKKTDITIRVFLSEDTQTAEVAVSPDPEENITYTPYLVKRTKNYPLPIQEVKEESERQRQYNTSRELLLHPGTKPNEYIQWDPWKTQFGFSISELGGYITRYHNSQTTFEDQDTLEIPKELWIQTVDALRPGEFVERVGFGHRRYFHTWFDETKLFNEEPTWDSSGDVDLKIEARLSARAGEILVGFSYRPLGSDQPWKSYETLMGEYRKQNEEDFNFPNTLAKKIMSGISPDKKKDFDPETFIELLRSLRHYAGE